MSKEMADLRNRLQESGATAKEHEGCLFFLCEWPDTATQTLEDKWAAVHAGLYEELKGTTWETLQVKVAEAAILSHQKSWFKLEEIPADALWRIQNSGNAKTGTWDVETLKQPDGKYCAYTAQYEYVRDKTLVMSYQDQIKMWSMVSFLSEASMKMTEFAENLRTVTATEFEC